MFCNIDHDQPCVSMAYSGVNFPLRTIFLLSLSVQRTKSTTLAQQPVDKTVYTLQPHCTFWPQPTPNLTTFPPKQNTMCGALPGHSQLSQFSPALSIGTAHTNARQLNHHVVVSLAECITRSFPALRRRWPSLVPVLNQIRSRALLPLARYDHHDYSRHA